MNITKTELSTKPFTVKKFKLECEGKEYIIIQEQNCSLIESIVYGQTWQKAKTEVMIHSHYSPLPTNEELIRLWDKLNPNQAKEHNPFTWLNEQQKAIAKVEEMLGGTEELEYPMDGGGDYSTFKVKPTLLQRIKNLFKKR